jgi:HAMP domain-containing protein
MGAVGKVGRQGLLLAVLAFAAALLGVAAGRWLFAPAPPLETAFHTLIHRDLALDAGQAHAIAGLERDFAASQARYAAQMAQDNRDLAQAIVAEKGYGPRVADAVDRAHRAMGMLQKETLQHLFAMRAVLRPDQQARFDAALVKALTRDSAPAAPQRP